ncbi:hypothetical protein [Luteitalea sp.]|nr:hypothetical protein [Luteitalea sp.]
MSQTARMVRPQAQGPARRGLAWEVVVIGVLLTAGWAFIGYGAAKSMGWW